jgi:predicted O-methyltransferase YrrM
MQNPIQMRNTDRLKNGLLDLVQFIGKKNMVMAEIGSYQGESTAIFASTGCFESIYAIDMWKNNYSKLSKASFQCDMAIVEKNFDKEIIKYPFILKIKDSGENAAKQFKDGVFDLVYIDANHEYASVKNDILTWIPKIKNNSYIAGHDYSHKINSKKALKYDVNRAVDEIFHNKKVSFFQDGSWMVKL